MTLVAKRLSVQYLHMLIKGVIPMPPPSKPIFSCSPSKVNFPYGASILAQSPSLSAFRAAEKSLSESFLVNSMCVFSVGLLDKLKCLLNSFPS